MKIKPYLIILQSKQQIKTQEKVFDNRFVDTNKREPYRQAKPQIVPKDMLSMPVNSDSRSLLLQASIIKNPITEMQLELPENTDLRPAGGIIEEEDEMDEEIKAEDLLKPDKP